MSTVRDKAILNSIFNPLLPLGEGVYTENIPDELKGLLIFFSLKCLTYKIYILSYLCIIFFK